MDSAGQPRDELRDLTVFGQDLAGALRPATVVEVFARALRAAFAPASSAIALIDQDSGRLRIMHALPQPTPWMEGLLEASIRQGPQAQSRELGAGHDIPPEASAHWMAVPIVTRQLPQGAVAVGRDAASYTAFDLNRLEAYASMAALALASATIVDQADETRRSWSETLDAVRLPLCIVERSGRMRRANRAFLESMHVSTAAAGVPWLALVPPAWGAGIQAALDAATGAEIDLPAGDRTCTVSAFPMGPGRPAEAFALIFHDRTERHRLQAQLLQSEKMSAVGQLVAGVAHDLNNPLASILGFADYLTESPDVPPALREPVRVIQQESLRAANIVRNLLSFARKQEHRRRNVGVGALIESTLALLHNQLLADHMDVRARGRSRPAGDPRGSQPDSAGARQPDQQCVPGRGADRAAGGMRIRARRWMDGVAVDVIDNGPGMTEAVASQVFEPFFTTKPEGQGTGLGLTICRRIVTEQGGRITLQTRPGEGAAFAIELPPRSRNWSRPPRRRSRPVIGSTSCWWTTNRTSFTTCAPPSKPGGTG